MHVESAFTERVGHALALCIEHVAENDRRSLGDEQARLRFALPFGRARYQRDLPVQPSRH